jgi:hypothetical protein
MDGERILLAMLHVHILNTHHNTRGGWMVGWMPGKEIYLLRRKACFPKNKI